VTITFAPYEPEHLRRIEVQAAQEEWRDRVLSSEYARNLGVPGFTWTGLDGGRVLGCAGLIPQGGGRAHAWALLGNIPPRAWPALVAKVRSVFDAAHAAGYARIEATVRHDFGNGCRLAKVLGFEVETLMAKYYDGIDHFLYARVAR
jgi:hypothetical protein